MSNAVTTLLLVGAILFLVGALKKRDAITEETRRRILANEGTDAEGNKIVYKLLPRSLDTYYRVEDNTPSKLYSSIFSIDAEDPRRI
jgi:hypothetical protein